MARTTLTKLVVANPYAATPVTTLTFAAGDAVNGNQFALTGSEVLIAHNTGAGARTITITSAADKYGRTKDLTAHSIAAGAYKIFPMFPIVGFRQSGGWLFVDVEHAEVQLAVADMRNSL